MKRSKPSFDLFEAVKVKSRKRSERKTLSFALFNSEKNSALCHHNMMPNVKRSFQVDNAISCRLKDQRLSAFQKSYLAVNRHSLIDELFLFLNDFICDSTYRHALGLAVVMMDIMILLAGKELSDDDTKAFGLVCLRITSKLCLMQDYHFSSDDFLEYFSDNNLLYFTARELNSIELNVLYFFKYDASHQTAFHWMDYLSRAFPNINQCLVNPLRPTDNYCLSDRVDAQELCMAAFLCPRYYHLGAQCIAWSCVLITVTYNTSPVVINLADIVLGSNMSWQLLIEGCLYVIDQYKKTKYASQYCDAQFSHVMSIIKGLSRGSPCSGQRRVSQVASPPQPNDVLTAEIYNLEGDLRAGLRVFPLPIERMSNEEEFRDEDIAAFFFD
mgnify:CR=1 FL=1